jgi:hypothetical protein
MAERNQNSIDRNNDNNNSSIDTCKQLKEELADLLTEEAQREKLRSLPLYSSKITGYRFLCSHCYDKKYLETYSKRKE